MKIRSSFNGCALSRLHSLRSSLLLSIALAAWTCATAQAADITILVNQGAVSGVRDLAAGYEKATGNKVIVDFAAGGQQDEKIRTDAPGDLVVNFLQSFDALIKDGKVIGPVVEFARAGNGVAVKAGAPAPDISSPEGFKRAMLNARSIGHSNAGTGPSTRGFSRNLASTIRSKTRSRSLRVKRWLLPSPRARSRSVFNKPM